MILSIIGPPGSGKSTQAKVLGKRLGIPVLSLGAELREETGKRSERSKNIEKYMKQGEPVPADIIRQEILEWIQEEVNGKGFIIDGFPRREFDAKLFHEEILPNLDIMSLPFLGLAELDIPLEESLKRIGARHKTKGQRKDEAEKTTRHRYKWYKDHRAKLKKFYEKLGKWNSIDGLRAVAPIQEELEKWAKEKEERLNNQILLIIGGQGSGKDTQAQKLEPLGYTVFSSGDAFRAEMKRKTKLGNFIKDRYMNAGKLVPDKYVDKVVYERIRQATVKGKKLVTTGVVRTLLQAKLLDKRLISTGTAIKKVIFIEVPKKELVTRITQRRVCPKCKRNYHLKYIKPKRKGLCDVCKVELIHREDDHPGPLNERLKIFYKQTKPILEYYKESERLYKVDGAPPPDKVAEYVREVVEK